MSLFFEIGVEVGEPGEGAARAGVGGVGFVGVGFAFEGYVAVREVGVAVLDQAQEPFQKVKYEEGDVEELELLTAVYEFVAEDAGRDGFPVAREYESEQGYGCETAYRQPSVFNYFRFHHLSIVEA